MVIRRSAKELRVARLRSLARKGGHATTAMTLTGSAGIPATIFEPSKRFAAELASTRSGEWKGAGFHGKS